MTKMTDQIETHLNAGMNMKKKDIMIGNFLGGLAWGFGTVVGASVVVAILVYTLKGIGLFDSVNWFLNDSKLTPPAIEKRLSE